MSEKSNLSRQQRELALEEMQDLLDRLAAETMVKARDVENLREQVEELRKNGSLDEHTEDDLKAIKADVSADWDKLQKMRKEIQDNLDVYLTPVPLPKKDS